MPFNVKKSGSGYKVFSPKGAKSKKSMSKSKALKQQAAIYANWKGESVERKDFTTELDKGLASLDAPSTPPPVTVETQEVPAAVVEVTPDNRPFVTQLDDAFGLNEEKWMQKAFSKHKGALHKSLDVPEDEKIPKSKMCAAAHGEHGEQAKKRAQAAVNANPGSYHCGSGEKS
jgi:hypothetical protein